MPHPAYITSVPACEKARLALSSGCLTSAHPYITFTLVPPVPNTCAPPRVCTYRTGYHLQPTHFPPMSRCFVFRPFGA